MNIYFPLWLLWAIPLGIYVIGVLFFFLAFLITRSHTGAVSGDRDPILKGIWMSLAWPLVLLILWFFSKVK